MKVRETKTGRVIEVNDSYGARLIEQGAAVLAPAKKPESAKKAAAAKKAEG